MTLKQFIRLISNKCIHCGGSMFDWSIEKSFCTKCGKKN